MDRRLPLLGLCVFLGPFGGNAVLSILFELERELSTDVATVTLSITVFMVPFAAIQLFSGPISDLWDRRGTVVVGLSLYAAGAVACGLSGTIGEFLISRAIQGIGFAFVNPVALAAVGELTRPSQRGRAMGWMGSLTTLGTATGPLYSGAAAALDWRLAFHGLALASLALAALLS
ncbi:MAG: MFS transporter, partial [Thermoplasmatota archaeon]